MSGLTSDTDEKGNVVIRDPAGNIVEIQTPDGQRIYLVAEQAAADCTCEWADDEGHLDSGPRPRIVKLNPECPNAEHRLAFRVTDWGPGDVEVTEP